MSTGTFQTKDWGLAQVIAYVTGTLPRSAKKVQGRTVFIFLEEDKHPDYPYAYINSLYFSKEGLEVSNVKQLMELGRDIKNIAFAAKEDQ